MKALVRFLLDAFYVSCFVAIMTAAAVGVHFLAQFAEQMHVDPVVVSMIHWLGRILAAIDALGVICGSGVSLYRFVMTLADDR